MSERLAVLGRILLLLIISSVMDRASEAISFEFGERTLSKKELAEAKAFKSADIDQAIHDLSVLIPQYPAWVARGSWPANANTEGAEKLDLMAGHNVRFSPEQIDEILPMLNHVDPTIRAHIVGTLNAEVGVYPVSATDWWDVNDPVRRKPYIDAWKQFWAENRDRYASEKPYIMKSLALDARRFGDSSVRITIENHSQKSIPFCTEAAGKWSRMEWEDKLRGSRLYAAFPYSIIQEGEARISPITPMALYLMELPQIPSAEALKAIPDREVHCEERMIPAGGTISYEMNLKDAYPNLRLLGQTIIVRYDFHPTVSTDARSASLWSGQLQSAPIQLP
jgi:hypothetical protein